MNNRLLLIDSKHLVEIIIDVMIPTHHGNAAPPTYTSACRYFTYKLPPELTPEQCDQIITDIFYKIISKIPGARYCRRSCGITITGIDEKMERGLSSKEVIELLNKRPADSVKQTINAPMIQDHWDNLIQNIVFVTVGEPERQ
jgi:hypothetical protein